MCSLLILEFPLEVSLDIIVQLLSFSQIVKILML